MARITIQPSTSVVLCAALVLGCIVILAIAFYWPLHETDRAVTLRSALSRLLFLGLISAGLWGLIWVKGDKKPLGLTLGLLALFWSDGLTHTPLQNPVASPSVYAPGLEQMNPKPALGKSRALLSLPALDEF